MLVCKELREVLRIRASSLENLSIRAPPSTFAFSPPRINVVRWKDPLTLATAALDRDSSSKLTYRAPHTPHPAFLANRQANIFRPQASRPLTAE